MVTVRVLTVPGRSVLVIVGGVRDRATSKSRCGSRDQDELHLAPSGIGVVAFSVTVRVELA